ncbi:hypothetical protein HQN88_14105 [Paenibacillus qinlingensis]|nr:hypothetical protein [Paenibacillus qinlingensis]
MAAYDNIWFDDFVDCQLENGIVRSCALVKAMSTRWSAMGSSRIFIPWNYYMAYGHLA